MRFTQSSKHLEPIVVNINTYPTIKSPAPAWAHPHRRPWRSGRGGDDNNGFHDFFDKDFFGGQAPDGDPHIANVSSSGVIFDS